jgi:SAM-dependent methyltransferase
MRDYQRLDRFLDGLLGDLYPEPPGGPHVSITASMIRRLSEEGILRSGQRVLDVGCGQGLALPQFAALGVAATGLTLGPDFDVCRAKGFAVHSMDQSFLEFADAEFDVLWCRHVLEHSVFPLFTLTQYRRVLKPGGHAYVEVPAPETSRRHEDNPNHYSVLGKSMWQSLFQRAGFSIAWVADFSFELPAGPDLYWGFLLRG